MWRKIWPATIQSRRGSQKQGLLRPEDKYPLTTAVLPPTKSQLSRAWTAINRLRGRDSILSVSMITSPATGYIGSNVMMDAIALETLRHGHIPMVVVESTGITTGGTFAKIC